MIKHENAIVHILWMMKELNEVGRRDGKVDVREDAPALAFCTRECPCPVLHSGENWVPPVGFHPYQEVWD